MKHVFSIHSHTIFLTSMGVIDYLKLKHEDIVFLLGRKYSCIYIPQDIKCVEFVHFNDYGSKPLNRKKLKTQLLDIDKMIANSIGEEFIFYCPHTGVNMQAIITNDKCIGMHYIQESCSDFYDIPFNWKRVLYWFQNIWMNEKRYYRQEDWNPTPNIIEKIRNTEIYAVSYNVFKSAPFKKNIVSWPKYELSIQLNDSYPVFVFDIAVACKLVSLELYLKAAQTIIKENAGEVSYIKFHPHESELEKKELHKIFENLNLKYLDLPQEIPMELVLAAHPRMQIVGYASSLVYFAKDLGHPVSQRTDLLCGEKKYAKFLMQVEKNMK